MPCSSSYMEPNEREKELRHTAQLLIYVREQLAYPIEAELRQTANDIYAKKDYVAHLCGLLKCQTTEDIERIVYNAHSKESRDLASWWDRHLEADKQRELDGRRQTKNDRLRKSAMAKLSPAERKALGL